MRAQKAPLRTLSTEEYQELQRIVKASSERLDRVRRAQALLAVAAGLPYTGAARQSGFKSGDSVAQLVERFNEHGLSALDIATGRGPYPTYDSAQRTRILHKVQSPPDRKLDGNATWSLSTLESWLCDEGASLD